jgi:hypothetical protein
LTAWRRPLAWLFRRLDRGRFMRHQASLDAVIESAGAWRRERVTYSFTGMEGVFYSRIECTREILNRPVDRPTQATR